MSYLSNWILTRSVLRETTRFTRTCVLEKLFMPKGRAPAMLWHTTGLARLRAGLVICFC